MKAHSEFPEIDDIKKDLDSLKDNVVELTKHMKSEGKSQANKVSSLALDRLADLKKSAAFEYHRAEKQVKAKPGQSIAIAFAAGLVASMLMRGNRG
jgi:ElaB/YqjD/DUF883 family membrane-anchored ribosome-binding protein